MTGPQDPPIVQGPWWPRIWPPPADVLAEWAPWMPDPDRPGIWLAPLPGPGCWPGDEHHTSAIPTAPATPIITGVTQ